jgi:hypothetical protein
MKTKKTVLLTISVISILLFSFPKVKAQQLELTPFIGYETGAVIHYGEGDLHIGDGMNWGGALNYGVGGGRYFEFSYNHLASYLDKEGALTSERLCDLATDYYSFGVLQELKPDAKATPYGTFTLGWVNYRPSENYSNENKMHISFAGGIKIRASERIGIRLQARVLLPIYYGGTYFSAGTGGAGYGVTGGFRGVQGDFTGGLVIMLR